MGKTRVSKIKTTGYTDETILKAIKGSGGIITSIANKLGCAMYRTESKEEEQLNLLQKKWGSKIVQRDKGSRRKNDFNPIIKIPIGGV